MKFIVPDEILRETTRCTYGFSCLQNGKEQQNQKEDYPRCLARYSIGENLVFVQASWLDPCPYILNYGNSAICTCPVRYAIYRKYAQ